MRTTSSTYLKGVFEGCLNFGAPEGALLRLIEGGRQGLDNPSRRYPARLLAEILNMAVEATEHQGMGVQVGTAIRPEVLLDIGYAFPFCQDIREVMAVNQTYQPLIQQNGRTTLVMRDKAAWIDWQPHYKDAEFYRYFVEMIFAGYASIGRWLLWGKDNPVLSVHFRHSEPRNTVMHKAVFADNIHFNAPHDAIEFMAHTVDVPMPNRNSDMLAFLRRRLDVQLDEFQNPIDIVIETQRCIQTSLVNGRPIIGDIAAILGMSERSLRRHLAAYGESFRSVLERARKDSCEIYLREGKYGQAEIAQLLGFSDQSAYSRAFKTWFGKTPRQYQAALKGA